MYISQLLRNRTNREESNKYFTNTFSCEFTEKLNVKMQSYQGNNTKKNASEFSKYYFFCKFADYINLIVVKYIYYILNI